MYASETLSGGAIVNASRVLTVAHDSIGAAQVETGAISAAKTIGFAHTILYRQMTS